jgi:hypothetical protein
MRAARNGNNGEVLVCLCYLNTIPPPEPLFLVEKLRHQAAARQMTTRPPSNSCTGESRRGASSALGLRLASEDAAAANNRFLDADLFQARGGRLERILCEHHEVGEFARLD